MWPGAKDGCLTSLRTSELPMPPKLNEQRAMFVMSKIDEILAWERRKETAGHRLASLRFAG